MNDEQRLRPDDGVSILEMWQLFVSNWRLMLGGLVAALFVAGTYIALTPKQYEVTLVVSIGQVGVPGGVEQIESAKDAVERMRAPKFINAVMGSLAWKGDERERLFRETYLVNSDGPASKYLNVRVLGIDPDGVSQAVSECLELLADNHRALSKYMVAARDEKLASITADIADTEVYLNRLELVAERISESNPEQNINMLQAMKLAKSRLRDLRAQASAMKRSADPEINTQTMAAQPILISSVRADQKVRRVWIFAVIGGLLFGIFFVCLSAIIRDIKNNSSRFIEKK